MCQMDFANDSREIKGLYAPCGGGDGPAACVKSIIVCDHMEKNYVTLNRCNASASLSMYINLSLWHLIVHSWCNLATDPAIDKAV